MSTPTPPRMRRPGRPLGLLACCLQLAACGFSAPPAPPDILLISLDTVRADHLGCYGAPRATSPNIDALAAQGVAFDHFFSSSDWTLPTHASLFTGLYPTTHGIIDNRAALCESFDLLPVLLQRHGYSTFGLYQNDYVGPEFGFDLGFERLTHIGQREELSTPIQMLLRIHLESSGPLFTFVHINLAHAPYGPARANEAAFLPRGLDGVERAELAIRRVNREAPALDPAAARDCNGLGPSSGAWLSAPDSMVYVEGLYDTGIWAADRLLGEILALYRASSRSFDQTVVVLTADHGEELMDRGAIGHSHSLYPEVTRVPAIFRYPPLLEPGGRVGVRATTVDIFATLLAVAGVAAPASIHGVDLMPWMHDEPGQRPVAHTEHGRARFAYHAGRYSIYGGYSAPWGFDRHRGELALLPPPGCDGHPGDVIELYDSRIDPEHCLNLAAEQPARVVALVEELSDRMLAGAFGIGSPEIEICELRGAPLSTQVQANLEALGYVE